MKKYALHPTYIVSPYDRDCHRIYISVEQLAEQYGLQIKDYIVWDRDKPETYRGRKWKDYIHLWPTIKVSEAQYFLNLLSIGDNDE